MTHSFFLDIRILNIDLRVQILRAVCVATEMLHQAHQPSTFVGNKQPCVDGSVTEQEYVADCVLRFKRLPVIPSERECEFKRER